MAAPEMDSSADENNTTLLKLHVAISILGFNIYKHKHCSSISQETSLWDIGQYPCDSQFLNYFIFVKLVAQFQ